MDYSAQKFTINNNNDQLISDRSDFLSNSEISADYIELLKKQLQSSYQNDQINAITAYEVIGSRGEFNQNIYSPDFYQRLISLAFDSSFSHPVHKSAISLISYLISNYPWTSFFFFQENLHLLSLFFLNFWASVTFNIKIDFISSLTVEEKEFLKSNDKRSKENDIPPENLVLILDSLASCNQDYYKTVVQLNYPHLLLQLLEYQDMIQKHPKIFSWAITSIQHLIVQPWITFDVPLPNICQLVISHINNNSPSILTAIYSILALCSLPDKIPDIAISEKTVSEAIAIFNNPPTPDCAQSVTEFLCNVLFYSNTQAITMIISRKIPEIAAWCFTKTPILRLKLLLLYLLQNCIMESPGSAISVLTPPFAQAILNTIENESLLIQEQCGCLLTRLIIALPAETVLTVLPNTSQLLIDLLESENIEIVQEVFLGLQVLYQKEELLDASHQEMKKLLKGSLKDKIEELSESNNELIHSIAHFFVGLPEFKQNELESKPN